MHLSKKAAQRLTEQMAHADQISAARSSYLTQAEINALAPWGHFPKKLRRFYVAQNGKCAYCGRIVEFTSSIKRHEHVKPHKVVPICDHVRPRLGGNGHDLSVGNKVLACCYCNRRKADRQPYPCELLFAAITAEIVLSMLPPHDRACYLGRQSKAKEQENDERI
jgi:hypothetical protein